MIQPQIYQQPTSFVQPYAATNIQQQPISLIQANTGQQAVINASSQQSNVIGGTLPLSSATISNIAPLIQSSNVGNQSPAKLINVSSCSASSISTATSSRYQPIRPMQPAVVSSSNILPLLIFLLQS